MIVLLRLPTIGLATLALLAIARGTPVLAKAAVEPGTDRVRAELVAPTDPAHQTIHDRLRQGRVFERIAEVLAPFRLPREVVVRAKSCGVDNAFYGDAEITICYEYLQNVLQNLRNASPAGEPTPSDAITGATLDVVLHEMAHAVFDLLKIPVFGREEDAADQFSTYFLLHLGRQDARALLLGVAYLGRREARDALSRHPQLKHYADEHGHPGQRYFDLLCTAYGFDRRMFEDAVSGWHLPADRAEGCADEYAQLHRAFETLVLPHIDPERLARVQAKGLLRFDIR